MRAREACRGDDALHRHGWIGKRDIFPDRAIEQHVFLQNDPDLPPQPCRVGCREVHTVNQDAPALRHVQTLDQLGEGALARS